MEEYPGKWITAPLESINGQSTVFVTGRSDVEKFRTKPRFSIRINVRFEFKKAEDGLPDENESEIIKEVTDRLVNAFAKDRAAVLTGIYTGDGCREWVFYTFNTNIFQKIFNLALSDLPLLPISISAENDPDWNEYNEMMESLSL